MSDSTVDEPRWVLFENPPGANWDEWLRAYALDAAGNVYISAGVFGQEEQVGLIACHDCAPLLMAGEHVYVSAKWAAKQYRDGDIPELCKAAEQRVREFFNWAPQPV